jgi:hypothetical protein
MRTHLPFALAALVLCACGASSPSTAPTPDASADAAALDGPAVDAAPTSPDAAGCPRASGLGFWPLVVCDAEGRGGSERFVSVEECVMLAGIDRSRIVTFGTEPVAASCAGALDARCASTGVRVCTFAQVRAVFTP